MSLEVRFTIHHQIHELRFGVGPGLKIVENQTFQNISTCTCIAKTISSNTENNWVFYILIPMIKSCPIKHISEHDTDLDIQNLFCIS